VPVDRSGRTKGGKKELMQKLVGAQMIAVAVMALAISYPAGATLTVQINGANNSGSINGGASCSDQTVAGGCDTNLAANHISWSTTALGGTVTLDITASDVAGVGFVGWTFNASSPTTIGSFTFAVSDIGFTSPPPPLVLKSVVSGTTSGTAATLKGDGYFGPSNNIFETDGAVTADLSDTLGAAQQTVASGLITSGSPYSLTEFITINVTSLSTDINKDFQVSGDVSTTSVPEPISIVLFGTVLLGLGRCFRGRTQS
jgi:hypothetical protein